jgi:hypothetical protein
MYEKMILPPPPQTTIPVHLTAYEVTSRTDYSQVTVLLFMENKQLSVVVVVVVVVVAAAAVVVCVVVGVFVIPRYRNTRRTTVVTQVHYRPMLQYKSTELFLIVIMVNRSLGCTWDCSGTGKSGWPQLNEAEKESKKGRRKSALQDLPISPYFRAAPRQG